MPSSHTQWPRCASAVVADPVLKGIQVCLQFLWRSTGPPKLHPPNHTPLTGQTLPAKPTTANSRFLTECYHLPAALSSVAGPKRSKRLRATADRVGPAEVPV